LGPHEAGGDARALRGPGYRKLSWLLQVAARVGGGEWAGQPARGREDGSGGEASPGGGGASTAMVCWLASCSPGWDAFVPGRPVPDLFASCSVFGYSGIRVFRGAPPASRVPGREFRWLGDTAESVATAGVGGTASGAGWSAGGREMAARRRSQYLSVLKGPVRALFTHGSRILEGKYRILGAPHLVPRWASATRSWVADAPSRDALPRNIYVRAGLFGAVPTHRFRYLLLRIREPWVFIACSGSCFASSARFCSGMPGG
jgi:hypothetical protein